MILSCKNKMPITPTIANSSLTYNSDPGTFIYCNNPEQLFTSDLGDHAAGFGNHYLLWSLVTGNCQAYYEHENRTGITIGYGIQIYNPNELAVTIEVTNLGFSNNAFGCWTQFYSNQSGGGGAVGSFTVQPGGVLWVQRNDNSIAAGSIFNGAVSFNVSGGNVYVFNYAYKSLDNVDGSATYLGYITRIDPSGQNEAKVYKGTSDRFLINSLISTKVSILLKSNSTWETHGCPGNDMVTINCPLTDTNSPTYSTFNCSNGDNLGNWGIRYRYNVTVVNDSNKRRTINVAVAQPFFISNIFIRDLDNGRGCAVNQTNWRFLEFALSPNETKTHTYEVILSGSSYGGLIHMISAK